MNLPANFGSVNHNLAIILATAVIFFVAVILDFYLPIFLLFFLSSLFLILAYHKFDIDEFHLLYVYLFITFFLPLIEVSSSIPKIRPEQFLAFSAFPLLLILTKREENKSLKVFITFFIVFQAFQVISLVYGFTRLGVQTGFKDLVELIRVAMYGLVAYSVGHYAISKEKLYELLYVILLFFAGCSLIGLFQYFGVMGLDTITAPLYFEGFIHDVHDRMMGTFVNPNTFGTFISLGVLIALGLLFYEKNTTKKLYIFFILALLVPTVILTQSRTAIVSLAVGIVIFILLYSYVRGYNVITFIFIFFGIVLLFGSMLFLMKDSLARYKTIFTFMEDKSWQMRLIVWYLNIQAYLQSPFLGWGPGLHQFSPTVDSEYLLVLRRYGIIGFMAYLPLYLHPVKNAFSGLKDGSILSIFNIIFLACVFTFLVSNITNPIFHSMQYMNFWCAFLGISYAANWAKPS